jgi:hypothetical protein
MRCVNRVAQRCLSDFADPVRQASAGSRRIAAGPFGRGRDAAVDYCMPGGGGGGNDPGGGGAR